MASLKHVKPTKKTLEIRASSDLVTEVRGDLWGPRGRLPPPPLWRFASSPPRMTNKNKSKKKKKKNHGDFLALQG